MASEFWPRGWWRADPCTQKGVGTEIAWAELAWGLHYARVPIHWANAACADLCGFVQIFPVYFGERRAHDVIMETRRADMARYVKLTIVYDMDDTERALGAELQDWIDGNVSLADLDTSEYEIVEVSESVARSWLGME